jgi:hypothetical protein
VDSGGVARWRGMWLVREFPSHELPIMNGRIAWEHLWLGTLKHRQAQVDRRARPQRKKPWRKARFETLNSFPSTKLGAT